MYKSLEWYGSVLVLEERPNLINLTENQPGSEVCLSVSPGDSDPTGPTDKPTALILSFIHRSRNTSWYVDLCSSLWCDSAASSRPLTENNLHTCCLSSCRFRPPPDAQLSLCLSGRPLIELREKLCSFKYSCLSDSDLIQTGSSLQEESSLSRSVI